MRAVVKVHMRSGKDHLGSLHFSDTTTDRKKAISDFLDGMTPLITKGGVLFLYHDEEGENLYEAVGINGLMIESVTVSFDEE